MYNLNHEVMNTIIDEGGHGSGWDGLKRRHRMAYHSIAQKGTGTAFKGTIMGSKPTVWSGLFAKGLHDELDILP